MDSHHNDPVYKLKNSLVEVLELRKHLRVKEKRGVDFVITKSTFLVRRCRKGCRVLLLVFVFVCFDKKERTNVSIIFSRLNLGVLLGRFLHCLRKRQKKSEKTDIPCLFCFIVISMTFSLVFEVFRPNRVPSDRFRK